VSAVSANSIANQNRENGANQNTWKQRVQREQAAAICTEGGAQKYRPVDPNIEPKPWVT